MTVAVLNRTWSLSRHQMKPFSFQESVLCRRFSSSGTSPSSPPPAVVFFDGGCPLCAKEIGIYQRMILNHSISDLKFIDISKEKNETALTQHGITLEEAMFRMHALDSDGNVQSGTQAFITMWEKLPYWKLLAKIVAVPGIIDIVETVYVFWAKRRNRLTGKETSDVLPGPGQSCRSTTTKGSK